MIVNSSGQIAPRTVHDHALCPLRLNLRFGHGGRDGRCDGQPGQRRPALSQPASTRAAHPVPPCPLRTILTSNNPPENGKADFLKFLALGYIRINATLRRFLPHRRRCPPATSRNTRDTRECRVPWDPPPETRPLEPAPWDSGGGETRAAAATAGTGQTAGTRGTASPDSTSQ